MSEPLNIDAIEGFWNTLAPGMLRATPDPERGTVLLSEAPQHIHALLAEVRRLRSYVPRPRPSDVGWLGSPPTEPGWYWCRFDMDDPDEYVVQRVYITPNGEPWVSSPCCGDDFTWSYDFCLGPLEVPGV